MFGLSGGQDKALAATMVGQAVVSATTFVPLFCSEHPEANATLERLVGDGPSGLDRIERFLAISQLYYAYKRAGTQAISQYGDDGQRAAQEMLKSIKQAALVHQRFGQAGWEDLLDLHYLAHLPENQNVYVCGSWVVFRLKSLAGDKTAANQANWTTEERAIAAGIDRFVSRALG